MIIGHDFHLGDHCEANSNSGNRVRNRFLSGKKMDLTFYRGRCDVFEHGGGGGGDDVEYGGDDIGGGDLDGGGGDESGDDRYGAQLL